MINKRAYDKYVSTVDLKAWRDGKIKVFMYGEWLAANRPTTTTNR